MARRMIDASRLESRLREIDRLIAEVDRLKVERELLQRLLEEAVLERADFSNGNGLMGPTEAVLDLLKKEPGIPQAEVVERLHDQISTRSADPRRTLYSTISNLRGKGKVVLQKGVLQLGD